MLNHLRLTCVLAVFAYTLCAQTIPINSTLKTTGMVGLVDTQTAQLNLLNAAITATTVSPACTATVVFLDANANVLKSAVVAVQPGRSTSVAIRGDADLKLTSNDRKEIRATVLTPAFPPPPNAAGSPTASTAICNLVPTLEIFDTSTGRTLVTLGHLHDVTTPAATSN